ncbi:hypothetical protein WOLCODRAFT_165778 [Wolfiporia cocos MD-104 SS10]|uniref:F-box domain-containing protein n=1 Tax=Wolfiporia cocos (strain MD-104) TaxID=742152 RepID=A0A2H3JDF9_WOLCO|nr:hypothetical protein WOLCODRAFT_165778 [Wolfiporia cocos MD-104 SS10]
MARIQFTIFPDADPPCNQTALDDQYEYENDQARADGQSFVALADSFEDLLLVEKAVSGGISSEGTTRYENRDFLPDVPMDDPRPAVMFVNETSASRMPLEIWEQIIDQLANDPAALVATEAVCRAWGTRSSFLLNRARWGWGYINDKKEAVYLARFARASPRHRQTLHAVSAYGRWDDDVKDKLPSLAHFADIVSMLAGLDLPKVSNLGLHNGEWKVGTIPNNMFLHLSAFTYVTKLTLVHITLPTVMVLGRLVCALHGLEELHFDDLSFVDGRLPPAHKRWDRPQDLQKLTVRALDSPTISLEVYCALIATKLAVPYKELMLLNNSLEIIQSSLLQRILHSAGPSLQFACIDISPLLHMESPDMNAGYVIEHHLNLSRNTHLEELWIHPTLDLDVGSVERSKLFSAVIRYISLTSPSALEKVKVQMTAYSIAREHESSEDHILLDVCCGLSPLDRLLSPVRYSRLTTLMLEISCDSDLYRKVRKMWSKLAATWFPALHARDIIHIRLLPGSLGRSGEPSEAEEPLDSMDDV